MTSSLSRRARPTYLAAWRRLARARSIDVTATLVDRPSLVLAPHPDDETLGCGAVVARLTDHGTPVRVVVASDGRGSHPRSTIDPLDLARIREQEFRLACSRLGVTPVDAVAWRHASGTLPDLVARLHEQIRDEIDRMDASVVYVTWSLDPHPDHHALSRAARLAVADRPRVRLLEYPIWGWVQGPWSRHPGVGLPERAWRFATEPLNELRRPPRAVTCGPYLQTKRRALEAHRTQFTNYTGEPDWWVLGDDFLGPLTGPTELFFEITPG